MKYIILILAILQIGCVNNTNKPYSQEQKIQEKDACELRLKSFNFKGFKIGMNLTEIASILSLEKHNDVVYGKVKHPEEYTIFKNRIKSIKLDFFKNKLYEITIETTTDLSKEVAEKFGVEACRSGNLIRVYNSDLSLSYIGNDEIKNPTFFFVISIPKVSNEVTFIEIHRFDKIKEKKEKEKMSDF